MLGPTVFFGNHTGRKLKKLPFVPSPSLAWYCAFVIPAFQMLEQNHELRASLAYIGRPMSEQRKQGSMRKRRRGEEEPELNPFLLPKKAVTGIQSG